MHSAALEREAGSATSPSISAGVIARLVKLLAVLPFLLLLKRQQYPRNMLAFLTFVHHC
jgi:hypothetical protein